MTYRTLAFYVLLLAVISIAVYWYVSRPTPDEQALRNFFSEFRKGKYTEAQHYAVGNDFYSMAAVTSVRDTNGSEYLIGDYFPQSKAWTLQNSIEVYVKRHIAKWKYLSMESQDMGDNTTVIRFRLELAIREFTGGSGPFGTIHDGTVEGNAYMQLENEQWKVEKFELTLISDSGMVLENYITRAF